MKVAILLGSVRIGRQSHKVAHYLENELIKRGVETDLIDLAKEPLPILEERLGYHPEIPESIQHMGARLHASDALLFVTPEYHGSFSGVIKNAIDYFRAEFQKKPIGVVATASGKMGGINASTQLQHVILSVGAYALPVKMLVPDISQAFNDSFEPQSEALAKSANRFLDEFLWLSDAVYLKKNKAITVEASN